MRIATYTFYGALIHLVFLPAILTSRKTSERPQVSNPVEIIITKSLKKKSDSIESAKTGFTNRVDVITQKQSNRQVDGFDSKKSTGAISSAPGRDYSSLLPQAGDLSFDSEKDRSVTSPDERRKNSWPAEFNEYSRKTLTLKADQIRNVIDIPLSARSRSNAGKATAVIERNFERNRFKIIILEGKPLLRAALFAFLSSEQAKVWLSEVFEASDLGRFSISIHLLESLHFQVREEAVSWRGNTLNIFYTKGGKGFTPRGVHRTGDYGYAFTLPDRIADRDMETDEIEFEKLRNSPAYNSVIRDREL